MELQGQTDSSEDSWRLRKKLPVSRFAATIPPMNTNCCLRSSVKYCCTYGQREVGWGRSAFLKNTKYPLFSCLSPSLRAYNRESSRLAVSLWAALRTGIHTIYSIYVYSSVAQVSNSKFDCKWCVRCQGGILTSMSRGCYYVITAVLSRRVFGRGERRRS